MSFCFVFLYDIAKQYHMSKGAFFPKYQQVSISITLVKTVTNKATTELLCDSEQHTDVFYRMNL